MEGEVASDDAFRLPWKVTPKLFVLWRHYHLVDRLWYNLALQKRRNCKYEHDPNQHANQPTGLHHSVSAPHLTTHHWLLSYGLYMWSCRGILMLRWNLNSSRSCGGLLSTEYILLDWCQFLWFFSDRFWLLEDRFRLDLLYWGGLHDDRLFYRILHRLIEEQWPFDAVLGHDTVR